MPTAESEFDIAVVGAGAAGLFAALRGAQAGARVALISATPLAQTASYWAQGGLAAALAGDDSPALHLADTERAGRGLVRRSAAAVLVEEAPARVQELQRLGVAFDADRYGRLALGLEGGHSIRRIVHAGGSATGRRVVRELSALVVDETNVAVLEGTRAASLWVQDGRCVGVVTEEGRAIAARAVILATGGAAALWSRTTNPPGSQGIGMLLAHLAGADLADLELMQFHPTAVTGIPGREGFLVTEAVRGEGATLHGGDGERFIDELAPRDEVARAIADQLAASGQHAVMLDMTAVDPARFPNVVQALRASGVDPARERIPVAPAAHYMMGGVVVDLASQSSVAGLYAVGENSCTGLHGANRLASNSLSECFVYAARAVQDALGREGVATAAGQAPAPEPLPRLTRETRESVWKHAGIVRDAASLGALLESDHPLARMVGRCGLERRESRGAHLRSDFPECDERMDMRHVLVAADGSSEIQTWL